jgi:hypothetical protein
MSFIPSSSLGLRSISIRRISVVCESCLIVIVGNILVGWLELLLHKRELIERNEERWMLLALGLVLQSLQQQAEVQKARKPQVQQRRLAGAG